MDRQQHVPEHGTPRQQCRALEDDADIAPRSYDWRAVEPGFSRRSRVRPPSTLSNVLLPQPLGPTTVRNSPACIGQIDRGQREDVVSVARIVSLRHPPHTINSRRPATLRRVSSGHARKNSGHMHAVSARRTSVLRYLAGTMAMISISTSIPGKASWLTFRKVCTGSGASPYCSALISEASFQ